MCYAIVGTVQKVSRFVGGGRFALKYQLISPDSNSNQALSLYTLVIT